MENIWESEDLDNLEVPPTKAEWLRVALTNAFVQTGLVERMRVDVAAERIRVRNGIIQWIFKAVSMVCVWCVVCVFVTFLVLARFSLACELVSLLGGGEMCYKSPYFLMGDKVLPEKYFELYCFVHQLGVYVCTRVRTVIIILRR